METEDTLDPTFAATAFERLGQICDDGVKAVGRRIDGVAHLPNLPLVLDKSQRGQEVGELVVGIAQGLRLAGLVGLGGPFTDGVNGGGQVAVRVAHDADRRLRRRPCPRRR